MNKDAGEFFFQDDPLLNQREAWLAQEFPEARYHYFRESGCIMTSLWNMCSHHRVPGFKEEFPTPWELNEACKAAGAFYPNANIELAELHKVLPVSYLDRFAFDEAALHEQLDGNTMCLLRVRGTNGPYHYVLPVASQDNETSCFDPKAGHTALSSYEEILQIIRFEKLWPQGDSIIGSARELLFFAHAKTNSDKPTKERQTMDNEQVKEFIEKLPEDIREQAKAAGSIEELRKILEDYSGFIPLTDEELKMAAGGCSTEVYGDVREDFDSSRMDERFLKGEDLGF